jgi:hypothetical protein
MRLPGHPRPIKCPILRPNSSEPLSMTFGPQTEVPELRMLMIDRPPP